MRMIKEMKEMRVCVLSSHRVKVDSVFGERGSGCPVERIEVGDDDVEVKVKMSENCVD